MIRLKFSAYELYPDWDFEPTEADLGPYVHDIDEATYDAWKRISLEHDEMTKAITILIETRNPPPPKEKTR